MSDSSNNSNGSTSKSQESKLKAAVPGERSSGHQTPSGAAKPTESDKGKEQSGVDARETATLGGSTDRAASADPASSTSAWDAVVDKKKDITSGSSEGDAVKSGSNASKSESNTGQSERNRDKSGSDTAKDNPTEPNEVNAKRNEEKGADEADAAPGEAKSGLSEVTQQAKTAASGMAAAASTATDKVQDLAAEAGDELEHVIEERKAEGAHQLHRLASAVGRAGGELQEEFPFAAGVVERGAQRFGRLADTIKERPVRTFATEASNVVRRRPAAVAGLMGVVGFAALRFLKATPPDKNVGGKRPDEGSEGETDKAVQRSLAGSADEHDANGSGDPGGTSPEAPGFKTQSSKGGATGNS